MAHPSLTSAHSPQRAPICHTHAHTRKDVHTTMPKKITLAPLTFAQKYHLTQQELASDMTNLLRKPQFLTPYNLLQQLGEYLDHCHTYNTEYAIECQDTVLLLVDRDEEQDGCWTGHARDCECICCNALSQEDYYDYWAGNW